MKKKRWVFFERLKSTDAEKIKGLHLLRECKGYARSYIMITYKEGDK